MNLFQLEKDLDYTFKNKQLLVHALTHSSYGHEKLGQLPAHIRDNERLEWLGDAILQASISIILFNNSPKLKEGALSIARVSFVKKDALFDVAFHTLCLQDHMMVGNGEIGSINSPRSSILSDALEAVIAAIYLDAGFDTVTTVIERLFF